ncbi:MurR/RpiR family transcriptional regulator [Mycoplasmopsis pullorum]|uniref:MurR/RpiR family transcriptional regulator n=1 Tax=Mycoplasmopsis pullorum TaxID=48003 RepID=UPI00111A3F8C|nr:MurR/RpiR family transcriptional regulator [Mycoplasmopsis pullorum]TNK83829.1 MurR/RpiR family transcriptional regulator [Mycoplasmopsis pullorum]TNK92443.1 MurR/RpiR family transcriptional regulator [Mycoplasmopsis pullorum]
MNRTQYIKTKESTLVKPFICINGNLTNTDQSILDYINSFSGEYFDLSQKELAIKSNTSEGGVSRFVHKIGFKHYREFLAHLNSVIRDFYKDYFNEQFKNSNMKHKNILLSHKYAIDNILSGQEHWEIDKFAEIIQQSRNVYILGLGSSQKYAQELHANLIKIGISSVACQDFHVFLPILGNLNENDTLFVISNKLENMEIDFSIKLANSKRAKVLVVTSNNFIRPQYRVNHKIVYANIHDTDKDVPISSKISQAVVIDLVFDALIKNYPQNRQKLANTKQVLDIWYNRRF